MARRWTSKPVDGTADGTILFDGFCLFCSRWVQFVIKRDPGAQFRFLALQTKRGRAFAAELGIDANNPETNAVVLAGRAYFESEAALQVLAACRAGRGYVASRSFRACCGTGSMTISPGTGIEFGRSNSCLVLPPEMARRHV